MRATGMAPPNDRLALRCTTRRAGNDRSGANRGVPAGGFRSLEEDASTIGRRSGGARKRGEARRTSGMIARRVTFAGLSRCGSTARSLSRFLRCSGSTRWRASRAMIGVAAPMIASFQFRVGALGAGVAEARAARLAGGAAATAKVRASVRGCGKPTGAASRYAAAVSSPRPSATAVMLKACSRRSRPARCASSSTAEASARRYSLATIAPWSVAPWSMP